MTDGKLSPPAILIVEDDQLLKFLTVNIVEEAGFVALHAASADEVVAILESRSGRCFVAHRHRHARQHGRVKTSSCGAQPLAAHQDCIRIRPSSALGKRFADEQPLFRQAISEIRSLIGA